MSSPALEAMYQDVILDHYKNPHHAGLREPYDAEVHHVNPTCGDEVRLRVKLVGGRIEDVSYDAMGCSISQASTSAMTDLVIGTSVEDSLELSEEFLAMMQSRGAVEPDEERLEDAVAFAGVAKYPTRVKCALLGWMAMKAAVAESVSKSQVSATSEGEGRT